jgi:hypothetical protein
MPETVLPAFTYSKHDMVTALLFDAGWAAMPWQHVTGSWPRQHMHCRGRSGALYVHGVTAGNLECQMIAWQLHEAAKAMGCYANMNGCIMSTCVCSELPELHCHLQA